MSSDYLLNPVEFLITTLVQLYILVVMLRFLLGYLRADFYNPVSQFVVKATNPPLRPLRRIIPGWGGMDVASLVLMLILQMLALGVVVMLRGGGVGPLGLLLWSVAELVELAFNVFIFAIIIQVVLSWVNPYGGNPATALLYSLTRPIMRPVERFIPPISGIDLSPLFALIGLELAKMLTVPLLKAIAFA